MSQGAKYGIGLLIVGTLLPMLLLLPMNPWALQLVEWIHGAGALGMGVYGLVYVLATLLLLPGSILTAGAGFAYGPLKGMLLVSSVSVLAATLAFILGRSAARGWVARRVRGHPRFGAIDQAIGEGSFKIVLLLRLSPILPFNVLNYALGLTRIRLRNYILASFLGMLPGTLLYVYIGSLVTSASELLTPARGRAGSWGQALYWGGLTATLAVTLVIAHAARKALHRAIKESEGTCPSAPREVRP